MSTSSKQQLNDLMRALNDELYPDELVDNELMAYHGTWGEFNEECELDYAQRVRDSK